MRDRNPQQTSLSGRSAILGWDIGGANLKIARLKPDESPSTCDSLCIPYEVQYAGAELAATLSSLARQLGADQGDLHAITMTAELSQAFRTKREGVDFVLNALEAGFPSRNLHVYTVEGEFVTPGEARKIPLRVAASNWAATARWVARSFPTCVLLDTGTTTTDLTPLVDGEVASRGWSDPERLLQRELVYTGAIRTPVESIVQRVPLCGGSAGVSAEGFALVGDAHLWLGQIAAESYTCRTPDGRPATRAYAGERLARVVCADREMLDDVGIDRIAAAVAEGQVSQIIDALRVLRMRHPQITTAVVTGVGDFIGRAAAQAAGLEVILLSQELPVRPQATPAAAVAWLLDESLTSVDEPRPV